MDLAQTRSFLHHEVFPPTVVVASSESAKRKIQETSHISVTDLLTPFAGPMTLQAESETRRMMIDGFKIRFVDMAEYYPVTCEVRDQKAIAALQLKHPADDLSKQSALTAATPLSQVIGQRWLERWIRAFFDASHFNAFESIDNPLCRVLVVCSDDADPVAVCADLNASLDALSAVQGYDSKIPVMVLYVYDAVLRTSQAFKEADAAVAAISVKFPEVFSWGANSGTDLIGIPEIQQGIFGIPLGSRVCRNLLWADVSDLKAFGESCASLACRWAFARFEQLDAIIARKRRGFANTIKSFWKSSGKAGEASGATLDWQSRIAADLAFHLRFYESAADLYKSVVSEFKQDQKYSEAASCLEMLGLCALLSGAPVFDFNKYSDAAVEQLMRASNKDGVFKSTLIFCLLQKQPLDAAQRLDAIASHSGLASTSGTTRAVVHEIMAAFFAKAGSLRKAAFQEILAGHSYRETGLRVWALQCYANVHKSTSQSGFMHIRDHVSFSLAKQLFASSDHDKCLEAFRDLFGERQTGPRAPDKQLNYFKGLMSLSKTGVKFETPVKMSGEVISFAVGFADPIAAGRRTAFMLGEPVSLAVKVTNVLAGLPVEIHDVRLILSSKTRQNLSFSVSLPGPSVGPGSMVDTNCVIALDHPGVYKIVSVEYRLGDFIPCKHDLHVEEEIAVRWAEFNMDGLPSGPVPAGSIVELQASSHIAPSVSNGSVFTVSGLQNRPHFDTSGKGLYLVENTGLNQVGVNLVASSLSNGLKLHHTERRVLSIQGSAGPSVKSLTRFGEGPQEVLVPVFENSGMDTVSLDGGAVSCVISASAANLQNQLPMRGLQILPSLAVEAGAAAQLLLFPAACDPASFKSDDSVRSLMENSITQTLGRTSRGDEIQANGTDDKTLHIYIPWTSRMGKGFASATHLLEEPKFDVSVVCPVSTSPNSQVLVRYEIVTGKSDVVGTLVPKSELQIFGVTRRLAQETPLCFEFVAESDKTGVFELPAVEILTDTGRVDISVNRLLFIR